MAIWVLTVFDPRGFQTLPCYSYWHNPIINIFVRVRERTLWGGSYRERASCMETYIYLRLMYHTIRVLYLVTSVAANAQVVQGTH